MRKEDYRATLILMFGLAAATLTGFLREAALAQQFGVGRSTDIYLIAFTIPEFVFIALPIILSPAFIPLFADLRLHLGERRAWRFSFRSAGALLAILLGLTIVAAAGAPLYLRWLAPGFDAAERAQAQGAEYLMLPAILLMGGATLAGAMLQVYRRFARPALATAIYNTVFVAALVALPLAWPVSRAAWGVTLGAGAALLIQLSLLWRFRPSARAAGETATALEKGKKSNSGDLQPAETGTHIGVRHLAGLAAPLAVGYGVHHLILFVDRAMATTVGVGGVATLNYAYRLALVVGQLSGLAVSTALFPSMAEQAAGKDLDGLRASLSSGLRFVWLLGLPSTLGLIILRKPLVEVIFQRGAFDQSATAAVSNVLIWYALAVLADALCQPLWRVLYAQRTMWPVLTINGLQTGIRLLANFALIGYLGYNGLALSAFLGLSVQALILGQLVRRRIGTFLPVGWWREGLGAVLAVVVAAVVAGLIRDGLSNSPAVLVLLISGVAGSVIYVGVIWPLRKWVVREKRVS